MLDNKISISLSIDGITISDLISLLHNFEINNCVIGSFNNSTCDNLNLIKNQFNSNDFDFKENKIK